MKSVSFAVDATHNSVVTFPVHSTGSASGAVVNVSTFGCASKVRASRAPGNDVTGMPACFISAGCNGSASKAVLPPVAAGGVVASAPPGWRKYEVGVAATGQSAASRHTLPGAPGSPAAPIT